MVIRQPFKIITEYISLHRKEVQRVVGCDGMSSVKGSVSHYLPATGQEFTVNSFNTENCTADTNNTGEAGAGR